MEKILVSACLLGQNVRYNGKDLKQDSPLLRRWKEEGRLVPFCPEMAGGLPVPRPPVEIQSLSGRLEDAQGKDFTEAFREGAAQALELCRSLNIRIAVLAEGSPSCGSSLVYDGSFSGRKIPGRGVTAGLLASEGIRVFSQDSVEEAADCLFRR